MMGEVRLIDANALLVSMGLENAVKYGNKNAEQQHNSYSTWMCYEIADEINGADTIDAEIVRHGLWTKKDNSKTCKRIGDFEEWFECSECEGSADRESAFCPECGAKMDAQEDA